MIAFADIVSQGPTPFAGSAPFFFTIGVERAVDASPREALLDVAMGPGRRRKSSEAIRRGRRPAEGLSLSAHDAQGGLVGTVRLWNVAAGTDAEGRDVAALLLGPLAVAGRCEGHGVGSALMRRAIAEAAWQGHGAIVLVGDPDYYARFGFTAAPMADLAMPGPFERHRLLGLELKPGALGRAQGLIRPTGRRLRASAPALPIALAG